MAKVIIEQGNVSIISEFENGQKCTVHSSGTNDVDFLNVRCEEVMELISPTEFGAKSRVKIVLGDRVLHAVGYALITDGKQDLLDAYNKAGVAPIPFRNETRLGSIFRRPICFLRTLAQV